MVTGPDPMAAVIRSPGDVPDTRPGEPGGGPNGTSASHPGTDSSDGGDMTWLRSKLLAFTGNCARCTHGKVAHQDGECVVCRRCRGFL